MATKSPSSKISNPPSQYSFYISYSGILTSAATLIQWLAQTDSLRINNDKLEARDSAGQLLIIKGLREFQEHLGGELTLAMPTKIGQITNVHEMPEEIVEYALSKVKAVAAK